MKINWDLLRGLPKSKSAWSVWLGDHYNKRNLNVPQIIVILIAQFDADMKIISRWLESEDGYFEICERFEEYNDVWKVFCVGVNLRAEYHFEHKVCEIVPGFSILLKRYRGI